MAIIASDMPRAEVESNANAVLKRLNRKASVQIDFLNQTYPQILSGETRLSEIASTDQARNFFSDWYSKENLTVILSMLYDFNASTLASKSNQAQSYTKPDIVFAGLMYGKQTIINSPLTNVLKSVVAQSKEDSELIYRMCFILTLPDKQRDKLLEEFMLEFPIDQRKSFLECVNRIKEELIQEILTPKILKELVARIWSSIEG